MTMNIFNGFETFDLLDFDAMLWASPDNIISNAVGNCAVSGGVENIILSFISEPGHVEISGSCDSAGTVNYIYVSAAQGECSVSAEISAVSMRIFVVGPSANIDLSASADVLGILVIQADVSVHVSGGSGSVSAISILAKAKKYYECRMMMDGYDDAILPIASFTSRQRAGDPSYSEVIVPGLEYLQDILDRQTGVFRVSVLLVKNGVTLQREILFETETSAISISGNTREQQIMLSGYRTSEAASIPAVVPVLGVNYRSLDMGVTTLRKPEPDLYLRPGDTVQYDGDEFIVELITFSFSAIYGSAMEISGT